jgi:hypothetical protein
MMNSIGILIRHPSIDPQKITQELALAPTRMACSGDPVVTPKGRTSGDHHKWSSWSYFDEDESKGIDLRAAQLLQKIEAHRDFISGIISSGGRVTLIIRSEGDSHMQCEFGPAELALLSSMSITIGFEVFAH